MIKRYVPIKKKRSKPRRGEPTREEKEAIRRQVYERSGGQCQLNLVPNCIKGVLPWDGSVTERWHLVHVHAKRRFGWEEKTNKLLGGCFNCHIIGVHQRGLKIKEDEE